MKIIEKSMAKKIRWRCFVYSNSRNDLALSLLICPKIIANINQISRLKNRCDNADVIKTKTKLCLIYILITLQNHLQDI